MSHFTKSWRFCAHTPKSDGSFRRVVSKLGEGGGGVLLSVMMRVEGSKEAVGYDSGEYRPTRAGGESRLQKR